MEKQNNQKPRLSWGEPPHRALHRASMTGQAPKSGEKRMPKRLPPQQELTRKKAPSPRKFHPVGCACAILVCAVFCVFALYSALSLSTLHRIHHFQYEIISEGEAIDGCENFLLIGKSASDNNPDWLAILTLNSKQKRYYVHALHPEMYVRIPDSYIDTLSGAYRSGSSALLCRAISANFELKIDGVVLISADGRENIADICRIKTDKNPPIDLSAQFDYMRTESGAIAAALQALNPANISEALAFRSKAADGIVTNISDASLYGWSLYRPLQLHGWTCETGCIPFDGTYDIEQRPDGTEVLAVDLERNVEILKQLLTE